MLRHYDDEDKEEIEEEEELMDDEEDDVGVSRKRKNTRDLCSSTMWPTNMKMRKRMRLQEIRSIEGLQLSSMTPHLLQVTKKKMKNILPMIAGALAMEESSTADPLTDYPSGYADCRPTNA